MAQEAHYRALDSKVASLTTSLGLVRPGASSLHIRAWGAGSL